MARSWRIVGAFHHVGEVVVIVTAPNWQGAIRKGALAIKGLPQLKGRRITVGSFSIQEVETVPVVADPTQASLLPISEAEHTAIAQAETTQAETSEVPAQAQEPGPGSTD